MLEDVTVPKELEFPVASSDEMSAVLTDSGIEAHASRTDDAKVGDDLFCVSPSCFALSLIDARAISEALFFNVLVVMIFSKFKNLTFLMMM